MSHAPIINQTFQIIGFILILGIVFQSQVSLAQQTVAQNKDVKQPLTSHSIQAGSPVPYRRQLVRVGDYAVKIAKYGLTVYYKKQIISQASYFSVWKAPGFFERAIRTSTKRGLGAFPATVSVHQNGKKISISKTVKGIAFEYSVLVSNQGVTVSLNVHSLPKVKVGNIQYGTFFFPHQLTKKSLFEISPNNQTGFLPGGPEESKEKIDNQISSYGKKFKIYSNKGIIEVSTNYPVTYLYDARFHHFPSGFNTFFLMSEVSPAKPSGTIMTSTLKFHPFNVTLAPRYDSPAPSEANVAVASGRIHLNNTFHKVWTGENVFYAEVVNHSQRAQKIIPEIYILSPEGTSIQAAEPIDLKPGEKKNVNIQYQIPTDATLFLLRVRDVNSKQLAYSSPQYPLVFPSLETRCRELISLTDASLDTLSEKNDPGLMITKIQDLKSQLLSMAQITKNNFIKENQWNALCTNLKIFQNTIAKIQVWYSAKSPQISSGDYFIYTENELTKIFKGDPIIREANLTQNMTVSGCRNEYVNFQVVTAPLFQDLKNVTLVPSDLIQTNGTGRIAKEYLECRVVEYVLCKKKLWPEILQTDKSFDVAITDNLQPAWITLYIPKGTPAGDYTGTLLVKPGNAPQTRIAINLTVWDFSIPTKNHMKFTGGFLARFLKEFYRLDKIPPAMNKQWTQFILDHRIFPFENPQATAAQKGPHGPAPESDEKVDLKLKHHDFFMAGCVSWEGWLKTGYFKKHPGYSYENYLEDTLKIQKEYAKYLRKKGLFEKAYFYRDESKIEKWLRDFLRKLKKETGGMKTVLIPLNVDIEKALEFYDDCVDVFVFNIKQFPAKGDLYKKLMAMKDQGKEIGWYSNPNYPPYPTFNVIDAPGTIHRILFWHQWKYKVDFNLAWSLNWWGGRNKSLVGKKVADHFFRGNACLIYPGKDRNPLSSIRLELIRDGVEDYEYLWLLNSKVEELKKRDQRGKFKGLIHEAQGLLDLDWIESLTQYPKEPEPLVNARQAVAEKICAINQALRN